jgi:hypothetical protein
MLVFNCVNIFYSSPVFIFSTPVQGWNGRTDGGVLHDVFNE